MKTAICALCGQPFYRRGKFGTGGHERYDAECREALAWARRVFGPSQKPKGDVTDEELERRMNHYFEARGWDRRVAW